MYVRTYMHVIIHTYQRSKGLRYVQTLDIIRHVYSVKHRIIIPCFLHKPQQSNAEFYLFQLTIHKDRGITL